MLVGSKPFGPLDRVTPEQWSEILGHAVNGLIYIREENEISLFHNPQDAENAGFSPLSTKAMDLISRTITCIQDDSGTLQKKLENIFNKSQLTVTDLTYEMILNPQEKTWQYLQKAQEERQQEMLKLPEHQRERINCLEECLSGLHEISIEHAKKWKSFLDIQNKISTTGSSNSCDDNKLYDSADQSSFSEDSNEAKLEAEYNFCRKEMKRKIMEILNKLNDFDFTLEEKDFSNFYSLTNFELDEFNLQLQYSQEEIIRRRINNYIFFNETLKFITANKDAILKSFLNQDRIEGLVEFWDKIEINISFKKDKLSMINHNETHNKGKSVLFISFSLAGENIIKVVYKPRNAQIDLSILDFFRELNEIHEKSLDKKLSVYKIINMENKGETVSIWEYIDGWMEHECVQKVVQNRGNQPEELQKLQRLESICKAIDLSDLHSENIIYREGPNGLEIIVIDLESLQINADTGLCEKPLQTPKLTDAENKLIADFKEKIPSTPFRMIPMATGELGGGELGQTSYKLYLRVIHSLWEALAYRYQMTISREKLEELLFYDYINGDVPYLTEYNSVLYYGLLEGQCPIARRQI